MRDVELVTLLDLLRGSIIALGRAPLPSEKQRATFSCSFFEPLQLVAYTCHIDMNRYYTGATGLAESSHIRQGWPNTSAVPLMQYKGPRPLSPE